jgi:hypothetical protein
MYTLSYAELFTLTVRNATLAELMYSGKRADLAGPVPRAEARGAILLARHVGRDPQP